MSNKVTVTIDRLIKTLNDLQSQAHKQARQHFIAGDIEESAILEQQAARIGQFRNHFCTLQLSWQQLLTQTSIELGYDTGTAQSALYKNRTPPSAFFHPILQTLNALGEASWEDIKHVLLPNMEDQFTKFDLTLRQTGRQHWEIAAGLERMILSNNGLIRFNKTRDKWKLTSLARQFLIKLREQEKA